MPNGYFGAGRSLSHASTRSKLSRIVNGSDCLREFVTPLQLSNHPLGASNEDTIARAPRREGYGFRLGHPGIEKNGQHGGKVALHSLVAPRQTEEPLIAENFDCPRISGWPSTARPTQKQ